MHLGNILYKCGWNHSLDNNVMNLHFVLCRHVRVEHVEIFVMMFIQSKYLNLVYFN